MERVQARMVARLEELQSSEDQLSTQKQRQPQLQAVMDVATQIEQLEKSESTCNEVGLERRHFMERLQHQRDYEKTTGRTRAKIQMLQNPDALCPLCDRP